MMPTDASDIDAKGTAASDLAHSADPAQARIARIRLGLQSTFAPLACEVTDESSLHAGHAGARSGGGHYRLRLVSDLFEGKNRVARQRLVYDCLQDMMTTEIHAIAMVTLTPSEAASGA